MQKKCSVGYIISIPVSKKDTYGYIYGRSNIYIYIYTYICMYLYILGCALR